MSKIVANEWMSLDGVVQRRPLRLVDHALTPKGAILATYARDRS